MSSLVPTLKCNTFRENLPSSEVLQLATHMKATLHSNFHFPRLLVKHSHKNCSLVTSISLCVRSDQARDETKLLCYDITHKL